MDFMVYLGGLGAVLIVAMGLLLFIASRQMRRATPRRRQPTEPARRGPRVQVVLPEVGEPLIWVVEGRRYAHPDGVTDSGARDALDAFLGQFRQLFPDGLPEVSLPLPVAGSSEGAGLEDTDAETAGRSEDDGGAERSAATAPVETADETLREFLPPPVAAPRAPLSYEEEMERPFLERLRSSFFGGGETRRATPPPASQLPQMPKLSDLDELMRERLAIASGLPATTVRTGSDGLLEFVVAGEVYHRISDIPHEGVRDVMREAVRIWESRLE